MDDSLKFIQDNLLKKGLITQKHLDKAQKEAERTGLTLEKALINSGAITLEKIMGVRADMLGVVYMDLGDYLIDPEVIRLVSEDTVKKHLTVPLFKIGDTLTIAMIDPSNIDAIDEVRRQSKCKVVDPVLSTEGDIRSTIDKFYGVGEDVDEVIKNLDQERESDIEEVTEAKMLEQMAEEKPIIRLVNIIIMQAVKDKASDIHIEPEEHNLRIRFRIDGVLRQKRIIPRQLQGAVISRVKILAKLDIAERRKPQDGRVGLRMENRPIDLRVSTYPTVYGENVVLRILDKANLVLGLDELGFTGKTREKYERLIDFPYGIILVTGPTGSGKTTTLYASLSKINSMERNIVTVEDPIEYELPLIRQSQVNPKAGVTFAAGLRSILRQDPDIIMVGEIRDQETAEIAIHSALTGHLVFSTLHTNTACGAVSRLIDMGVEPFLVESSLIGVLAQRLVRKICPKCKEKYKPKKELLKELGLMELDGKEIYHGKGCKHCDGTGYKGRVGLFELLVVDEQAKDLILNKASSDKIEDYARSKQGMVTMWEDGIGKVKSGMTTIDEVARVIQETQL